MTHTLLFHKPVPSVKRTSEGYRLNWSGTGLMGILNVTPDSFSDGGKYLQTETALRHAHKLLADGALILDIGGESTRPGAESVSAKVELDRILPVVKALVETTDTLLSVDTSKPEVAHAALSAGAHLVNDVSSLRNPEMRAVCADWGVPAVIMHMQGEPRTMQHEPVYEDVVAEVTTFLMGQAEKALAHGLPSVILDPGFGFGKTVAHNLALVRHLDKLVATGYPVLLGASRKKTIDKLATVPNPADRDPGSLALHLWSALQGAALLRVHNVAAHAQALKVWKAVANA